MQIFQRSILKKYIDGIDAEKLDKLYEHYSGYFLNPEIQENILDCKEEQFQEGFLRELFVNLLGYTIKPSINYNLATEIKNEGNQKKADGAIFVNDKVVGVIELKDHKTPDLSQIEAQAFGYKNKHKEAVYVAVSNYEKLRFYIDNAVDYEEFDLFHLTRNDFARLWICLAYENIKNNLPKQIKAASLTNEEQITNALYKDYSNFKRDLFEDILKNNPTDDTEHKILLFKKTQKLLDRLLFIFFAEDRGLLPPNSIMMVINQWEKLKELDEYQPFYNRLKKYFGYMNTGFQGKNYEVFAYNGGLFKPDEVLDGLNISDDVLKNYCKKIADYDFASDVDVNILGHIFENSLTEIEEITTKLQQGEAPTISKRKKDGVFYTPQYITKYIVENTVGKLCKEKKAELGIKEEEYFADKKRQVATKKTLVGKLDTYREWLLQISICDPACGSGAFLNAALNFLIAEHKLIDEMSAKVAGESIVFPNVENSILENNLYGVDINEESVEIAKLSLWLRTAKPHRKLNSLNNNIKCGNSLIDDPAIAGDKAFNWQTEFPKVFEKGGFDVVIGNPPYLNLTKNNTDNLVLDQYMVKYQSIKKSNSKNLYTLFNEKGASLVKDKGVLSYIIPEGFLKTRSYQDCLNEMLSHGSIDVAMYFEDWVFADATTGSLIFRFIKDEYGLSCKNLFMHKNHEITEIEEKEDGILTIYNNKQSLKLTEVCGLFKGMVVGDRKNSVNYDSVRPNKFYLGNCINRYLFKDEFYCDYDKLKIIGGTSKKEKYDIAPRILIRRTGNTLCCVLLQEPALTESTLYSCYTILPDYNLKYILALLNSSLYTYVVQQKMVTNEQAFPQILMTDLENILIPMISSEDQQPFVSFADQMLSLNADLQQKRQRFLRRIQDNLGVQKVTSALERFDELDFKAFVAELKKQKISLSLAQQDEWEDYFNQYKAECNALTAQITATDNEIDQKVYELYGLDDDDVKVIEGE